MAVHSANVNGRKEISKVSNKEMLELMEITDEVRKQIGKTVIVLAAQLISEVLCLFRRAGISIHNLVCFAPARWMSECQGRYCDCGW